MYKKDLSRKSEGVESAPSENPSGHDYSQGFRSSEGYAVCSDCGAQENTDKAARKCARLVFPMTEDWEICRRMIEDRAKAELRMDIVEDHELRIEDRAKAELMRGAAAAPADSALDDPGGEIVEGAEYWILDPQPEMQTPVLACVQDLQKLGVVLFTIGSEQGGYRVCTMPCEIFSLRRNLATILRRARGKTL